MEVGDFTSTVACFMRLTWAAAAGRLDLVGSQQPIRETHSALLPQGVRTRVSSTGGKENYKKKYVSVSLISMLCDIVAHASAGSNCSSSSEGEATPTALHAGICVRQQSVSIKDAIIAREALSLLVTCLQLRCQQMCKRLCIISVPP